MGQTLTHGIYLPDEGERNCYAGLAANWQLLDNSVGTVAEHTTQIAGKAPAVHTHTKADITDLFNSANTWSGNNSYTGIVTLNSSSDVAEQFKQQLPKDVSTSNDAMARVNSLVDSAGHYVVVETLGHWSNYAAKNITLKYKNDSTKQGAVEFRLYSDGSGIFYSQSPFACDLGNAYNKWKSFNGVNPGALSLPGTGGYTDIKGDIANLSGGDNTFTAPYDGWVCIKSANATAIHIINTTWAVSQSAAQSIAGTLCCLCPVMAGQSFNVIVNATSLDYAYIHPCCGNV